MGRDAAHDAPDGVHSPRGLPYTRQSRHIREPAREVAISAARHRAPHFTTCVLCFLLRLLSCVTRVNFVLHIYCTPPILKIDFINGNAPDCSTKQYKPPWQCCILHPTPLAHDAHVVPPCTPACRHLAPGMPGNTPAMGIATSSFSCLRR
nr:hypothetical protein RVX_1283 [Nitratidesulfovibrio sp. HK-II]